MIAAANGIWIGQRKARTLRGATFTRQDLLLLGPGSKSADALEGLLDLLGFTYTSVVMTPTGSASLQNHMAWVKANIIAGRAVALGVSAKGEYDTEYDHIIPVSL